MTMENSLPLYSAEFLKWFSVKKIFVFFIILYQIIFYPPILLAGENYLIGHKQLKLYDKKRNNRLVSAELYYPATTMANQLSIADGSFPLLIFSHGYQQYYSDYHDIWKGLVKSGYIMAFLTTETGLVIDIDDYSEDMVFLLNKFSQKDIKEQTILVEHYNGKSVFMGHSTGGGASILAQSKHAQSNGIIIMAALGELYGPIFGNSPIENAHKVKIPSLIISGSEDCICPVSNHQQAIYNNLSSDIKVMLTINGGDHCGFSDSWNCPIAEAVSCGIFGQKTTIDNRSQMLMTLKFINLWLDYILIGNLESWSTFKSYIKNNPQKIKVQFQEKE